MNAKIENKYNELVCKEAELKNELDPNKKIEIIDELISMRQEYMKMLNKGRVVYLILFIIFFIIFIGFAFLPAYIKRTTKRNYCARRIRQLYEQKVTLK